MELIVLVYVDFLFEFEFCLLLSLLSLLLMMENVEVGYGDKIVLKLVKFNFVLGFCIGFLGWNGVGKFILIKLLVEEIVV